jgi:hypothetical protein
MEWVTGEINNASTVLSVSFVGIQFVIRLKLSHENLTVKH